MRQVNFVAIFAVIVLLVLFALENPEPATITVLPTVKLQLPLAVELISAMGIGAVFAWVFSVWSGLQRLMDLRGAKQEIEMLQTQVEKLTVEVEQRKRLAPAKAAIDVEVEDKTDDKAKAASK